MSKLIYFVIPVNIKTTDNSMKIYLKTSSAALIALLFFFNNAKAQTKADSMDTTHTSGGPYSKVEVEASFPGGAAAWTTYIMKQMLKNGDEFRKKDFGTCIVKFIVDKNGNISDVEATNMQKTRLAKIVVEAIRNGPKWVPAQQNGKPVNAYRLQPVTVTEPEK
ncbi:MAG: energy transducer TonB [Ginsengibacter sp.]